MSSERWVIGLVCQSVIVVTMRDACRKATNIDRSLRAGGAFAKQVGAFGPEQLKYLCAYTLT
jgi:hypothetical protein